MAPLIRTSQAPEGHTPILRPPARHRQKISVVAALCRQPASGRLRLFHESFPDMYVKHECLGNFVPEDLNQLLFAVEHVLNETVQDAQRLQGMFDNTPLKW